MANVIIVCIEISLFMRLIWKIFQNLVVQSDDVSENYVWIPLHPEDANALFSSRSFHGAKKTLEKGNMTLLLADQLILSKVKTVLKGKKGCGEFPTFRSLIEAEEYVSKRELGNPSEFDQIVDMYSSPTFKESLNWIQN